MRLRTSLGVMIVAGLLIAVNTSRLRAADPPTPEWLRGSGNDLQLRLQGEVFEANGRTATPIQISGHITTAHSKHPIVPQVDGHRFEIWIPLNQPHLHSVQLRVASSESGRIAYLRLYTYEFRQAAIDGIKLTLRSPTRQVQVTVFDEGQRVADAFVKAEVDYETDLRSKTDANGVAHFGFLPEQKLTGLTAWTEDFRIGGFGFHRTPIRDPDSNYHTIGLSHCRDQKLRFLDEYGKPVSGVDFVMQMATPDPHYNYIGINENSRMTTDAAGEAIYKWFPEWKNHHFYVELKSDKWLTHLEEHRQVDDVVVFDLQKSKHADRKRVRGRVISDNSPGGFFVTFFSFQGELENRSERIRTFTDADGTFSVDVLPDATYAAHVLDARWVGEIIDFIPYQSTFSLITSPELTVSEGQEVEVTVTSGSLKRPVPNLTIGFVREHLLVWKENGEVRQGTGHIQWWVTTDQSGRAVTHTLPGKLKASVYTPLWRTEQTVEVGRGKPVKMHIHRDIE